MSEQEQEEDRKDQVITESLYTFRHFVTGEMRLIHQNQKVDGLAGGDTRRRHGVYIPIGV